MKSSNSSVMSELGWWIVSRMVHPRAASCFSVCMIVTAMSLSRPLVGSSKKMQDGCVMSSSPTDSLRFWPPEMPLIPAASLPTSVSAQSTRPCKRSPLGSCL